jgi:putative metallohydrolase (TIGR04338 family)
MPVPKIYHAADQTARLLRHQTGPIRNRQDYVDHITSSIWWSDRCPIELTSITVVEVPDKDVGGMASVEDDCGRIVLGRGRVNANRVALSDPWVILHELAHLLVIDPSDGHHGPRFVRSYIDLVERYLGTDAAAELARQCQQANIRINYRHLGDLMSV